MTQERIDAEQLKAEQTDEYYDYLDALRFSGVTNMYGATPYLMDEFPELDKREARKVLTQWMTDFSEGGK